MRLLRGSERIFIFFLVMATVAVAVSFWSKPPVSSSPSENSNDESLPAGAGGPDEEEPVHANTVVAGQGGQVYSRDDLGFSLTVDSQAIRENSVEGVQTVYFDDNTLSVVPAEQLAMIESSFSVTAEEAVQIDGVDGREITARSQKDGAEMRILLLTKGSRVYYFQGTELFIEDVVKSFQWKDANTVKE